MEGQELVLVKVQDVEYDMGCRNGCQGSSGDRCRLGLIPWKS